ncbi:MAG: NAD-dependent epimerase/dehydratase family protein [Hyphomicrobiales bacterium]|nr:NAD-dependent epimerase/dehydratase family protein [Hyphomicrobiales bacterium]
MHELPKRGHRLRLLLRRPSALPLACTSAVIGDLAHPQNMAQALVGVDAVIHSAGLAHAMTGVPEDDYRLLNTEATIRLAQAAQRAGVRRFVFLSSIRAQCGPVERAVQTEAIAPKPEDAYGRSKLAAERGLAGLDLDWVALRPVLVYGRGVRGNMAALLRLARSRWPLPIGSLAARRSLLSLDNLVEAIDCVLRHAAPLRRALIVADPEPLTAAEMVAAIRRGLDRRPGVFSMPPALLGAACRLAGREQAFRRLAGPLVADPAALGTCGWQPVTTSREGLRKLATETGDEAA